MSRMKKGRSKYNNIKMLFVDEAQDLNETQYNIIKFIKEITKCSVHMVGDPNQNIYQFRGSYEQYMLNHNGIVFNLTQNFRSTP